MGEYLSSFVGIMRILECILPQIDPFGATNSVISGIPVSGRLLGVLEKEDHGGVVEFAVGDQLGHRSCFCSR